MACNDRESIASAAISLCEALMRNGWVKRILFLCDRKELRKQRNKTRYGKPTHGVDAFDSQLRTIGCKVQEMEADGNCLFRAIADRFHIFLSQSPRSGSNAQP